MMKTKMFFTVAVIVVMSLCSCSATYAVRERPGNVVYVRPHAPSPNHVWVSGNWVWRGGRYVWQEGYWTTRRNGSRYIEGYWKNTRKGYSWRTGYWERY